MQTTQLIDCWRTGSSIFDLTRPLFIGILNLTPDSFSDGGDFVSAESALAQARHLVRRGARLLDLGAESTRPGAIPITEAEEWKRLGPVLEQLRREIPGIALSVDTRHTGIAVKALEQGVSVINDVTGFRNPGMLHLARSRNCGVIAMRSRLQNGGLFMPDYAGGKGATAERVIQEMRDIRNDLLDAGIDQERILLDPGFGFGTTYEEDLALWNALPELPRLLEWPQEHVCIGISRKRFVAWRAGTPDIPPQQRDTLTDSAHQQLLEAGFRVFRTHEVPEPFIRRAEAKDASAVAQVQVSSWRAAYRGILPESLLSELSIKGLEEVCRNLIASPPSPSHHIWLLERSAEIQGFAAVGPCRETDLDPAVIAELYAIYLLPETWRLGHGRELLRQSLRDLESMGFQAVTLWVLERNVSARKFYESTGWRLDGASRTEWHEGYALREVRYRIEMKD